MLKSSFLYIYLFISTINKGIVKLTIFFPESVFVACLINQVTFYYSDPEKFSLITIITELVLD